MPVYNPLSSLFLLPLILYAVLLLDRESVLFTLCEAVWVYVKLDGVICRTNNLEVSEDQKKEGISAMIFIILFL